MGRNDALRAARLRRGWRSLEAAAGALTEHGQQLLDDRQFTVSARTWRRWEGERPGWPAEETAVVLHDALGRWPEDLGFTTPPGWIRPEHHEEEQVNRRAFTSVTAAALVAGPMAPQHVDPALVDYFQQQSATAREPDQAVEIARNVATIAIETRSARMYRELATLEREMRPWHDAPVGRDLAEILAPVTEGN
ncbi:hypothetical protein [Streptomyces sp. ADI98-10]|uniref:hypothetical protein n=1 Tax=Streptomyces sp. ADI98-10 TaxID=1522763 RepID=UPI000F54D529|nr:hypothetical protein [Streptomyces sp. ADI98-10]